MTVKMRIEKTSTWQIENAKGEYCSTVYSLHDAKLVKGLAENIPNLKCLGKSKKQPKGIYILKNKIPIVEVYDKRLAREVKQNITFLKG